MVILAVRDMPQMHITNNLFVDLKVIRAIIIDDEPHCISALKFDLKTFCSNVTVIDTCQNAASGLSSIRKNEPDLVFLDIEMPSMDGLQMLEQLGPEIDFQLVFTTAHDRFAARAFRLSAVDYLLKPVDSTDLQQAIEKVRLRLGKNSSRQLSRLKHNYTHPMDEQRVALPQREGYDFVKVKDIMYCSADGGYTVISLMEGKKVLLSKSLGEVAEMLPVELFERIHHSTLINISYIKQFIKRDGGHIVMQDGMELAVSKSKKEQILYRLGLAK